MAGLRDALERAHPAILEAQAAPQILGDGLGGFQPKADYATGAGPVAVALADKIDTLVGFFAIDEKPTGSKDPFALRRAALGVIRLILENGLRLKLRDVFAFAYSGFYDQGGFEQNQPKAVVAQLLEFFADRLKVALKEQGVRHDLIAAVFALGDEDDLVRLMARVKALQDLAHAVRVASGAKVVAITGSAGKTTTKESIAALLATRLQVVKTSEPPGRKAGVKVGSVADLVGKLNAAFRDSLSQPDARARLERILPDAPASPALRHVQLALAREHAA